MSTGLFEQAKALGQTIDVAMDEVRFVDFVQGRGCIGTKDLNGCSAVGIVSKFGAILAHIPPHPGRDWDDPHAGDRHVQKKMGEMIALYRQHEARFPPGRTTWIISAIYQGDVALPHQRTIIENSIRTVGLAYANAAYIVVEPDDPRGPGQGTVFINASGYVPALYVEDRLIGL